MITTLYDLETNQRVGNFRDGYYMVDGMRPNLEYPLTELEVVFANYPEYDWETEKLISYWTVSNSQYIETIDIVELNAEELESIRISKIPEEISKRQLKIALLTQLNIEGPQIDIMISQIPDETQRKITEIEWKDGAFVKRTHPMVNLFAEQLGLSQRQLDDLFTFAKDI